eukprot:c18668_g1_i2.p1 GENE.c18668_g1_i2~~c18668_g1_i2.p1  ORF type:complete len:264 (-),score=66.33 c18668_g1_i2:173-964(-)
MSANFWKSTHCANWLFQSDHPNFSDLNGKLNKDEYFIVKAYFSQFTQNLTKSLKLKQRVAATATVYFRRYIFCQGFGGDHAKNPYLICATCVYVASKVEECCVSASSIVREAKILEKENFHFNDHAILDQEFEILNALNFDLIVHHPYRCLQKYHDDAGGDHHSLQTSWAILNDSYKSDIPLIFAPHKIALAAIYMAGTVCRFPDLDSWLENLNIDINEIIEVASTMVQAYEVLASRNVSSDIQSMAVLRVRVQELLQRCQSG